MCCRYAHMGKGSGILTMPKSLCRVTFSIRPEPLYSASMALLEVSTSLWAASMYVGFFLVAGGHSDCQCRAYFVQSLCHQTPDSSPEGSERCLIAWRICGVRCSIDNLARLLRCLIPPAISGLRILRHTPGSVHQSTTTFISPTICNREELASVCTLG